MEFTYGELSDILQQWAENDSTEFTTAIPTFIELAQFRICRDLNLFEEHVTATASMSQGSPSLTALAIDIVRIRFIYYTNTSNETILLLPKSESFLYSYWPVTSTQGAPKYYCMTNARAVKVAPTPDSTYPYVIGYIKVAPNLLDSSVSGDNTWISNNLSDLLTFAALVEAFSFEKAWGGQVDTGQVAAWESRYQRALAAAKGNLNYKDYNDDYTSRKV